ncbi:hypothetical protein, partial [Thiomonas sp. SCN 64-16]
MRASSRQFDARESGFEARMLKNSNLEGTVANVRRVFQQPIRMVASVNCCMKMLYKNSDRSGDAQWQGAAMNQA